jgi:hypothetical protein
MLTERAAAEPGEGTFGKGKGRTSRDSGAAPTPADRGQRHYFGGKRSAPSRRMTSPFR